MIRALGNKLLGLLIVLMAFATPACKHGPEREFELRVHATGKGRLFEFDPREGKLSAWGTNGLLLEVWLSTSFPRFGTTHREIPPDCRGGFAIEKLFGRVGGVDNQLADDHKIEFLACPQPGAPEGWTGWHASFGPSWVQPGRSVLSTGGPPQSADFAVSVINGGKAVRVSSRTLKAEVALPADPEHPLRRWPDLVGLALAAGVVQVAADGKYDIVE